MYNYYKILTYQLIVKINSYYFQRITNLTTDYYLINTSNNSQIIINIFNELILTTESYYFIYISNDFNCLLFFSILAVSFLMIQKIFDYLKLFVIYIIHIQHFCIILLAFHVQSGYSTNYSFKSLKLKFLLICKTVIINNKQLPIC